MVTKEDIYEASLVLFAKKGFDGTSISDIAKAVKLQKQSVYAHIESKEQLFLEVLRLQADPVNQGIADCLKESDDKSVEELLKSVAESIFRSFSVKERLLLWKRSFLDYCGQNDREVSKRIDWKFDTRLRVQLHEILGTRTNSTLEPSLFRHFFLSYMMLIHGYLDAMLLFGHDESEWQRIWDQYWNGCKPLIEQQRCIAKSACP